MGDRARKMAEQELSDTNETLADLSVQNQSLTSARRKLDQDLSDLRHEADEELRVEQDAAQGLERDRKDMEIRAHELQVSLDEAEANAIKWGRKMVAKLETRAKDLEAELDSEQRRLGDATKNLRKCERGIKELTFRQDEDRKNNERMHDLCDKLQQQVRTYKKQIEEAEEIAAMNLSKFRKAQVDLQESLERADISEQALAKSRIRGRSMSMARDFN